jgi:hypothetical protein
MIDHLMPERPHTRALKFAHSFHHVDAKAVIVTTHVSTPEIHAFVVS